MQDCDFPQTIQVYKAESDEKIYGKKDESFGACL